MKQIYQAFAAASLAAVSFSASAWWGAPYAHPYGVAPAFALSEQQQTAIAEQQRAFALQQAKAFEQAMQAQRQYHERLAAGQAHFAGPFAVHPEPFLEPMDAPFAEAIPSLESSMKDAETRRAEAVKEMEARVKELQARRSARPDAATSEARRAEMVKQMEARRAEIVGQRPAAPEFADRDSRHEQRVKQMQARHAEMMKQVEAKRQEMDTLRAQREI